MFSVANGPNAWYHIRQASMKWPPFYCIDYEHNVEHHKQPFSLPFHFRFHEILSHRSNPNFIDNDIVSVHSHDTVACHD